MARRRRRSRRRSRRSPRRASVVTPRGNTSVRRRRYPKSKIKGVPSSAKTNPWRGPQRNAKVVKGTLKKPMRWQNKQARQFAKAGSPKREFYPAKNKSNASKRRRRRRR